jgi:hypothetical protein
MEFRVKIYIVDSTLMIINEFKFQRCAREYFLSRVITESRVFSSPQKKKREKFNYTILICIDPLLLVLGAARFSASFATGLGLCAVKHSHCAVHQAPDYREENILSRHDDEEHGNEMA